MTTTTTGSLIRGVQVGLANWSNPLGRILTVYGNPSGTLFAFPPSGLAYDLNSGSVYMAVSGTTSYDWIALTSGAY